MVGSWTVRELCPSTEDGTYIVYGADSFGVSIGVMLSCVQDIS